MPASAPSSSIKPFTKMHDRRGAIGCRVPDGIGNAQPRRAGTKRCREQRSQRIGIGPRSVLGDVHHLQALAGCEPDRRFSHLLQVVERPSLRILPNGTG